MVNSINIPKEFDFERIKKYINTHKERGEESSILSWSGIPNLYMFFYLYLFKKYKQSCLINVNTGAIGSSNFIVLDFPKLKAVPTKIFINGKIQKNKIIFDEYGQHIADCINTDKKIILIPIRIVQPSSGHANVLIYNKKSKELSLFEPHGLSGYYDGYYIDEVLEYITKQINSHLSEDKKIKYVPSLETCPTDIIEHAPGYSIVNRFGVQLFENRSTIKREIREGAGYCAIWSMFFAELSLANPERSTKDIYNDIYNYIRDDIGLENAGNYLLYVARGYSKVVNEKLNKYFSTLYDFYIDTDDYVDFVKKLNYKNSVLYDKITNAYLNMEFNIEKDGIDRVYEGYNSLKKMPEFATRLLNPHDPFTLEINILEKIKNKELLQNITPVSNASIKSYSANKESANEIIIEKMDELIESPIAVKGKGKPCKPGKVKNANGRCVKAENITKTKKQKSELEREIKPTTLKVKPPCKPGKERNANGRCVKIKQHEKEKILSSLSSSSLSLPTPPSIISFPRMESPKPKTLKIKPPCKPGKIRNANGRCVKAKNISKKNKTIKAKPCKPGKTRNANGRCVKTKNVNKK